MENIILGVAPRRTLLFTDMRSAREQIAQLAERYNLHVPLDVNVQDLSVGNLQRIEILKALYRSISLSSSTSRRPSSRPRRPTGFSG